MMNMHRTASQRGRRLPDHRERHAAEHGYGLPAFNVNNVEQLHAVLGAARSVDSPAIVAASAGARTDAGEPFLRYLMLATIEVYPARLSALFMPAHICSPTTRTTRISAATSSSSVTLSERAAGRSASSTSSGYRVVLEPIAA